MDYNLIIKIKEIYTLKPHLYLHWDLLITNIIDNTCICEPLIVILTCASYSVLNTECTMRVKSLYENLNIALQIINGMSILMQFECLY